ncbi:LPXTG cell wall anchor domain-containing protein [Streptomyces sp. ISL-112]|uniref:LPXTG cell wall anchor domain-containing protein n=1 Tax=unclassified Streptomyces TaxID=2593676 RepID=UPI001BE9EF4D|nr:MULTISPECIES: LPXTG cell wall anchor domain-containing protein [unclassified Streptomyces]MBT2430024.1 LPXTG cell wall anchor domain-containing protein [Streptomyces sp. ISL-112]MBT2461484.1 LPXTG cell wall anchor domain-containing protein [Streptomyces sp. ISL-63]
MNKISATTLAALTVAGSTLALAPIASADGTSSGSGNSGSGVFTTTLNPVPTNHVAGSGTAKIELKGNQATVTVDAQGLLGGVPHAQHIHIDGQGRCPTAADAGTHNGHKSMSTSDGMKAYGMIGTSLTTSGDNSPTSALAVKRFPMGSSFHYQRTQTVTAKVADSIRRNNSVIVVHGIDFDGSGKFTNVLGASELDPKLPQVATAPALCGVMRGQMTGGVAAGSGGTQGLQHTGLMAGGAALLVGGAGYLVTRRRKASDRA